MTLTPGDEIVPPKRTSQPLRPRARLLRAFGDELISSESVALTELVKNSYDADATGVLIRFVAPLEVGAGRIEVIDNGHGMTLDTIQTTWMEPGTLNRKRNKRSEGLGRRVLGEKDEHDAHPNEARPGENATEWPPEPPCRNRGHDEQRQGDGQACPNLPQKTGDLRVSHEARPEVVVQPRQNGRDDREENQKSDGATQRTSSDNSSTSIVGSRSAASLATLIYETRSSQATPTPASRPKKCASKDVPLRAG